MAVLLSSPRSRALRLAAQIFGGWYAVLLAVSATVSVSTLEAGGPWYWPGWLLHRGADHVCLMCGLTRSFSAMSHGQFGLAAQYNAAGPILYVAMLVLACWTIGSIAADVWRKRAYVVPRAATGR